MAFDYGLIGRWKKRREEKKMEEAFERGKTESPTAPRVVVPSGKTGSSTVTVETYAKTPSPTYTPSPSRSSGGSSRKSSRSSGSSSQTPSPPAAPTATPTPKPEEVKVLRSGGVRQGRITYSGEAVVPAFGLTANEIRRRSVQDAKEAGYSGRRGSYSATYKATPKVLEQTTELNGSTGFGQNLDFGKMKEEIQQQQADFSMFGTSSPPNPKLDYNLQTQPYIKQEVSGYIQGTKTPIFDTIFVDPTVMGKQYERKATPEEKLLLESSKSTLSLETGTAVSKPSFSYKLRTFGKDVESFIGADFTSEQKGFVATEKFLSEGAKTIIPGKAGEITSGVIKGIIPTTPGEFALTALSFGAGTVAGAGVKGASALTTKIPKIGGLVSSGVKLSAGAGGAYLGGAYAIGVGGQIISTKDYEKKGELIGSSARELFAMGKGFRHGGKGFDIAAGKWATRGRTEIPIERLVPKEVLTGQKSFPTAPSKTHLKLFEGTAKRFPELSEGKPGAFHTTPDVFWKSGKIVPQSGKSELSGLYASSDVSIHFAKLSGSSSKTRLFPKVSEMFAPEGKPGIAFIQPKGFRINRWTGRAAKPRAEGEFQAEFSKPVKPGIADIPQMKTEIEAIFRPGSGEYGLKSQKYYTKVKGQRIPIDKFEFIKATGNPGKAAKPKGKTSIEKPGSYSKPKISSYSIIEPRSYLFSGYGKSSSSPTSRISPRISSYSPTSRKSSHSSSVSPSSYSPTSRISPRISSYSPTSRKSSHSSSVSPSSYSPTAKKRKPFIPRIEGAMKKPSIGKIGGAFKGQYTQSFAGYTLGVIGKTKGLQIGGKEVYTGMEIRGKLKGKKSKSPKRKKRSRR